MRRYSLTGIGLPIVCVGLLAACVSVPASARPAVSFRAAAVPIPIDPNNARSATYPGTGSILGAGADMEGEWKISGSEYGGSPSPLTWIKVYTPAGMKLNPQAFGTCSESILAADGPEGCPKDSLAGPIGEGLGVVTFGGERVHEKVSVHVFFRPDGYIFYVYGGSPALIEVMSQGTVLAAPSPFAQLLSGEVPLVTTVPEGLDASVEQIRIVIGSAYRTGSKLISYATVPNSCPRSGVTTVKSELSFLDGETLPAVSRIPCPRRRSGRPRR
jgi:hypothetical protein